MVGERSVRFQEEGHRLDGQRLKDRPEHLAGHAAAAIEHDLERLDGVHVDQREHLGGVAGQYVEWRGGAGCGNRRQGIVTQRHLLHFI